MDTFKIYKQIKVLAQQPDISTCLPSLTVKPTPVPNNEQQMQTKSRNNLQNKGVCVCVCAKAKTD